MAGTRDDQESGHEQSILVASQTARHLIRILGSSDGGMSEYELYDKYMTSVGAYIPLPNPKGEVARNLYALKESGLVTEDRGVLRTGGAALRAVQAVGATDLTAELVETAGFRAMLSDELIFVASAWCTSSSSSCKCTSSSSSSSWGVVAES